MSINYKFNLFFKYIFSIFKNILNYMVYILSYNNTFLSFIKKLIFYLVNS